jgi:uncharacterized protein (DUF2147 family)
MKQLLIQILILIGAATVGLRAQSVSIADPLIGKWTNEEKSRTIEFRKAADKMEGIIISASDPSLIGKKQFTEVELQNGQYRGSLHLPRKNRRFSCTIKMLNNGSLEITAQAGFSSRSQIWTRVD